MNASAASRQDLLAGMIDLLEQEYVALRRADGAAVTRIADAKRKLTETLAGVDWPTATGTDLAALLGRCNDLNRRNGELVHLQQGMLARAMRVLSGGDTGPATYGARGQTSARPSGRHIASV